MLRFTKMNGAGNDFILIDNRAGDIHLNHTKSRAFVIATAVSERTEFCCWKTHRTTPISECATLMQMEEKRKCAGMARAASRVLQTGWQAPTAKFPLKLQLASFRRSWLETSSLCK